MRCASERCAGVSGQGHRLICVNLWNESSLRARDMFIFREGILVPSHWQTARERRGVKLRTANGFHRMKSQTKCHETELSLQREYEVCFVRVELFMAGTMKNVVFWDIKTQFIPHRRHITSWLQSQAG
jgi:hypothetical protein